MAYSTQRAVSDGTMAYLDVSIQYMKRGDISVFYNDLLANPATWAWVGTTDKRIAFTPNVPNGVEVLLKRSTQINTIINVFSNGAKFNNATMDQDFTQLLYLNQEAVEGAALTDIFNDVDFHGYKIKNVGAAVDDTDVVSFGQLKTMSTGAYAAQLAAEAARDLAAKWASQLTTTVDGTSYSAKQYALNATGSATASADSASAAAGSAGAASASASTATTQAAASLSSANASQTSRLVSEAARDSAITYRDQAGASATSAAASAVSAAGSAATAAGFRFGNALSYNTNQTLNSSHRGNTVQYYGPTGGVYTLEQSTAGGGIPSGTSLWICNNGPGTLDLVCQGADKLYNGLSLNTNITLLRFESVLIEYRGGGTEIDTIGGSYNARIAAVNGGITMTGGRILGLPAPTVAQEAATKDYVDTGDSAAAAALSTAVALRMAKAGISGNSSYSAAAVSLGTGGSFNVLGLNFTMPASAAGVVVGQASCSLYFASAVVNLSDFNVHLEVYDTVSNSTVASGSPVQKTVRPNDQYFVFPACVGVTATGLVAGRTYQMRLLVSAGSSGVTQNSQLNFVSYLTL